MCVLFTSSRGPSPLLQLQCGYSSPAFHWASSGHHQSGGVGPGKAGAHVLHAAPDLLSMANKSSSGAPAWSTDLSARTRLALSLEGSRNGAW